MTADTILMYELKSAVTVAVFYMFYRLLLSRETFHKVNRMVLLGTAAASFILPLCVVTLTKVIEAPVFPASESMALEAAGEMAGEAAAQSSGFWSILLLAILLAGTIVVLARTAFSAIDIARIIRRGSPRMLPDGTRVIVSADAENEFSWFGNIVLPQQGWESTSREIIIHEKAHIALRHSYDVLFTDILTAFQWFNPAVWMLRSDLRAIHEYQADDAVLRSSGIKTSQYQYLLVSKALGGSGYTVANGFNHSILKNRISMMLAHPSSRRDALKVLYIVPIVGISLAANAHTEYILAEPEGVEAAANEISGKEDVKASKKAKYAMITSDVPETYTEVDVKPSFNGGDMKDFGAWVGSQIRYDRELRDAGVQGIVTLSFVVSKEGSVKNVRILSSPDQRLEAEAVRIVTMSPKWSPAIKDGMPADVMMTFPVRFMLK